MTAIKPLTGDELIAKMRSMPDASKRDRARACGYVSSKKDGSERLNFTAYYEALAVAHGAKLSTKRAGKGGRRLSYSTKVLVTGALQIGKRYVEELGLKPGDEVEISVTKKSISLKPLG